MHAYRPQGPVFTIEMTAGLGAERIAVVAVVARNGPRFFVCQRPHDKRHGGQWEFPGGKVQPGEALADAAAREMHEELGLEVVAFGETLGVIADPGSQFDIVFVSASIEGVPTLHEHIAYQWATLAELKQLHLAPSDARFTETVLMESA